MDVPPFFWGEHIHQLKLTVIYPGILKFLNPFFSLVSVVSSDALFFFASNFSSPSTSGIVR